MLNSGDIVRLTKLMTADEEYPVEVGDVGIVGEHYGTGGDQVFDVMWFRHGLITEISYFPDQLEKIDD